MIRVIFIVVSIIFSIVIRYKLNDNRERNIINLVLSKLDFCPNHYKIFKKDNKIFIKCHYYSNNYSQLLFNSYISNIIRKNSNNDYYITSYSREKASTIILSNYDKTKELGIISYDILIDMKNKNYKIIIFYFQIINCIKDDNENTYTKLITYLEDKTFYIKINYIYDNDLNFFNSNIINHNELFYKEFEKKETINRYNYIDKFNITITNDKEKLVLNPILIKIRSLPYILTQISSFIDIKPLINNNITIKKISGTFI